MGAFNSLHDKLKEFSETEEEQDQEYSTPQRVMRHKFLAGFDPRSPTEDIDRTPIVVDGTPNVVSTKCLRSRLSAQQDGPEDPRSPSSDFPRTPLSLGHVSSDSCDTPVRVPIGVPEVKGNDSQELSVGRLSAEVHLSGVLDGSGPHSDSDLDITSTTEESLVESIDTAPLLEGTEKLHLTCGLDKQTNNSSSGQESETDDSFSSQRKPRCRPMNRILNQNISGNKDKGRSPLSQVENSSRVSKMPRKIVMPGGKNNYNPINTNSVSVDKENICH